MNNFKLNENIGFYRKQHGLTQEDLAKALGVTNQSVSKWESAQCCPDISLIPQIAEIFEVSIDELFGKEPKVNAENGELLLYDDDVFRVFVAQGKRILTVEDMNDLNNDKVIDIRFPKNCNETTRQYFKVEVFGNMYCDASINGDVVSHGNIECNMINGAVLECRENIDCAGDINGCASAKSVACDGDINGNVNAQGVACDGDINGDISALSVACDGDINGDITGKNIVCEGEITGDVFYENN